MRDLHRTEEPIGVAGLAWSADGNRLFFGTHDWSGGRSEQLWSIPGGGGPPIRYDTNVGLITRIAASPDGRRIALEARRNDPDQMWVLENFLPKAGAKK